MERGAKKPQAPELLQESWKPDLNQSCIWGGDESGPVKNPNPGGKSLMDILGGHMATIWLRKDMKQSYESSYRRVDTVPQKRACAVSEDSVNGCWGPKHQSSPPQWTVVPTDEAGVRKKQGQQ